MHSLRLFFKGFLPLFFMLIVSSCREEDTPKTLFSGTIAFNATLSSGDPFANYAPEYEAIFKTGARGVQTSAPWASLNPTGSTFDFAPISNPYFGLDILKFQGFETVFLNIPIITIDKRSMPADIVTLSFDDAIVKSRFRATIDAIKSKINDRVKYISLGNEVDTYFSTRAAEWPAYVALVEDARSYIRTIWPEMQVGVTTTFEGATSSAVSQINVLNANMDIVVLTYYPISNAFVPRDPSTVGADISKMLTASGGKRIIMQEWGYPSSTALGSSESKQAQFFTNSFNELKKHGGIKFPFVSFFKYRDWNESHVQTITGQTSGQNFYEFMSSLGLKRNDGVSKEAFKAVESAMKL